MLHGISFTTFLLLCLIKPLNAQIIVNLINEDDKNLYFTISNDNTYFLEINETRYGMIRSIFLLDKSQIKNNSPLIIRNNNEVYYFRIKKMDIFEDLYINKSTYYLGYHLESIDNKAKAINSLSTKIEFDNIYESFSFNDIFDFSLDFLPKIKTNKTFISSSSSIDLFVKENTYPYLKYNISHYSFSLGLKKENDYYCFLLDEYYYFESSINTVGDDRCLDLFLPNNYSSNEININFKLEINSYLFNKSYKIIIDNLIYHNYSYFNIEKDECDNVNEKKTIFVY